MSTRRATPSEAKKVRRIIALKERVIAAAKRLEAAIASIRTSDALVYESPVGDGETDSFEDRVFQVGKPSGKYVVFKELDIIANRALTAGDKAALAQTDAAAVAKTTRKVEKMAETLAAFASPKPRKPKTATA